MKRKEVTFLSVLGMAVLITIMTTSMSFAAPALALGHFNKPSGLADFGGLPTNDKTNDFGGLDKDHSSGYDTFLDGTNSAISGFPADEEKINGPANSEVGNRDGAKAEDEGGIVNSRESASSDSYKDFQGCLSDAERAEGSPTELEVQDCVELSYSGIDSNENTPTGSTDEDENGVTEDGSTDEGEDSEE
ncbi:MAG: hypothetical protein QN716_00625 [Nitrososphaeraceae archaeon]|nr:hypothetical protein [Nitrososphaeraceae archaeon]